MNDVGTGDLGDFLRQVPLTILLAPIVFGTIYVILMIFVFRRAAERRRRKREAELLQMGIAPEPQPKPAPRSGGISPLAFLRGQLPDRPLEPAAWAVPAALRTLPEPDLDLLAAPASVIRPVAVPSVQPQATLAEATQGSIPAPAPEPDWAQMVTPVSPQSAPHNAPIQPEPDPVPANVTVPGDAVEVMRAWRDLSDGSLIVQMGDQRYRSLAEIQSADLARRFAALVRELNTMAGGAPIRNTNTVPAIKDSGMVIPGPGATTSDMKARLGKLQVPEPEAKPGFIKSITGRGKKEDAKGQQSAPHGIADAVETFLQFKLSNTPEFATRSIHIRPTPDHGLRIEVDGHFYEAITDVVDPDVREFLLNMMREWEARQ